MYPITKMKCNKTFKLKYISRGCPPRKNKTAHFILPLSKIKHLTRSVQGRDKINYGNLSKADRFKIKTKKRGKNTNSCFIIFLNFFFITIN